MKIILTIEDGQLNVDVEGMSVVMALGVMETAKHMMLNGDIAPTTSPEPEEVEVADE